MNIFGNVNGITGFSTHTREFYEALKRNGINVTLNQMNDTENIIIDLPYSWTKDCIGFGVFEGSKIHTSWKYYCDKAKKILVPSNHVKQAFINGGVDENKLFIVPEGVNRSIFNDNIPKDKDIFTFLYVGGWSQYTKDRKGLDIALKAFTEEFTDEPVRFIAHINTAYAVLNYSELVKSLNLTGCASKIYLHTDFLTSDQLAKMYRNADVFVAPTKAEGFGLNILESMSCGTPAIVTGYGGQMDFCNKDNSWIIDYDMIKATDHNIFYEEAFWGYPSINHLRKLMRESYENKDLLGQKSKNSILTAKQFTWDNAVEKFIKITKEW